MEFKGADEIRARLAALASRVPKEVGAALYQEALIIGKESMERTPVEFGNLKASHVVGKPEHKGNEISVSIDVGGPAAPYAIYVHENEEANHPRGGRAKFLESAIHDAVPGLPERLAKRVDLNRAAR